MIPQEVIRSILDSVRIVDVVSEFVSLKKRGSNFVGLCPFHNEKTPSFNVSPVRGIYKCFGCGNAGDAVHFIMEHEKVSYPEALKYLAGKYGIEVKEEFSSPRNKEAESAKEALYLLNGFAEELFIRNLWDSEKGKAIAHSYFRERGLEDQTIKTFHLGYNGDEKSAVCDEILAKGYTAEDLEKTGLGISRDGIFLDRFRSRVIFPIHNLTGRVIGFGGRTLRSDKQVAKYVNSPESEVYNKGKELYGLFFARKDIVKVDECYITEGYTDVISLHQSGITNAVAPLGTSLTDDQVKLISRYTKNIVLIFDGDEAGRKATIRAIDMILAAGMNVSVVNFPEGEDSDSFCRSRGDEEVQKFLAGSRKDFVTFHLGNNKTAWENDPVHKAEIMKGIVASICRIPDHLTRSLFVGQFAQKSGIDERSLIFELNKQRKEFLRQSLGSGQIFPEEKIRIQSQPMSPARVHEAGVEMKEERIISYLLKYGSENLVFPVQMENSIIREVTMLISDFIVGEIEKDQIRFRFDRFRRIYDYYRDRLEKDEIPDVSEILETGDSEMKQVCYDLLASRHELSEKWYEKFHITTPEEKNNLKAHINRDLYALKLSEVMIRLEDFEERMKAATVEEMAGLMQQQQLLSQAKKALADKLGMIIK